MEEKKKGDKLKIYSIVMVQKQEYKTWMTEIFWIDLGMAAILCSPGQ